MEARFNWMLASAGVSDKTLDCLGDAGLTSLAVFRHVAKDEDKLRAFLKKDPIKLDEDNTVEEALEVARIVSVYEAAKETILVENKHRAERLYQDLPPRVHPGEVDSLKELFESTEYELNPIQIPSEAYYERKTHELEARYVAEPLSRVTNSKQQDINDSRNMSWDNVTGTFKEKGKIFSVPMPKTADGLRARLKTMGVCWHFLKLKAPSRFELKTAEGAVFDRYTDWLCGPSVWGYATEDIDGKPIATPCLDHVLILDLQIRKKVAELMNKGMDLKRAFGTATADTKIFQTHFLNHVTIDMKSKKCTDLTAPGIAEAHAALAGSSGQATKRALEDDDGRLSKAQLDRIKKKAKKEASDAARRQLGLTGGIPGAPRAPGQGQSKGAKKRAALRLTNGQAPPPAAPGAARPRAILNGGVGDGKGGGKGKGNGACYAWNDSKPCVKDPCPFKHICSKCGSADHKRGACTA